MFIKLSAVPWMRYTAIAALVAVAPACAGGGSDGGPRATGNGLPECADASLSVVEPVPALTFAPTYIARSEGFFERYGLTVEQLNTSGGGPDLAALMAGDVEFNSAPGDYNILAYAQGAKNVIPIYQSLHKSTIDLALSAKAAEAAGVTQESPIEERLAALGGLKIGVTRPGSLTSHTADYMLEVADASADVIAVGSGTTMLAAYKAGTVDAVLTGPPIPKAAAQTDNGVMIYGSELPGISPFMMNNYNTRKRYMDEHPGCVARFVAAVHDANQWIMDQPAERIADSLSQYFTEIDRELLVDAVVRIKEAINPTGIQSVESVENTLDFLGNDDVSAEELMDLWNPEFVPQ